MQSGPKRPCELGKPTQQELLASVSGKTTTVLAVLNQMVTDGAVNEVPEGRSRRYRAIVPLEQITPAVSEGTNKGVGWLP